MIRNLFHALIGVVIILAVGWLVAQPTVKNQISPGGHHAILGFLAAVAVFVVFSVFRAVRPKKKPAQRTSYPYTSGGGR